MTYGQAAALQGKLKATVLLQEKAFDRSHCATFNPAGKKMLELRKRLSVCLRVQTHALTAFLLFHKF